MTFARRLAVGIALARSSARVVVQVPALLVPGLLQTVALVAVVALLLGVGLDGGRGGDALALLLALFVTTVTGVLAGAVVVVVTADRMAGGSASLREGVAATVRHLPALVGWSLLNATVGLVLRLVEERLGALGRWVTGPLGIAFSVGTVLVVPFIVLDGAGPVAALRRSAGVVRTRAAEGFAGTTALALATGLALFGSLLLVVVPLFAVSGAAALVAMGLLCVGWSTVGAVLQAVLSAALHRVASGQPSSPVFGDLARFVPAPPAYQPSYPGPHGSWDAS